MDVITTSGTGSGGGADNTVSGLPPANALTDDQQAEYCRRTSPVEVALPEEEGVRQPSSELRREAVVWRELAPFTPAGLRNDVALLAADYQALADGSRTFPQLNNEVRVAFGRVVGYRKLIC